MKSSNKLEQVLLVSATVPPNQLCENILDVLRIAFTDDVGTRRAIVVPLVVLIELRGEIISVQLLG